MSGGRGQERRTQQGPCNDTPEDNQVLRTAANGSLVLGWDVDAQGDRPIGFITQPASPIAEPEQANLLAIPKEGHVMVFGATGTGKGVSSLIPQALIYPGPLICVSQKGELEHVTLRRRRDLGQKVVVIDPFSVSSHQSGALNALDLIDPDSPSAVDDAVMLVQALESGSGQDARDKFWSQRASHLLVGIVLYVVTELPKADRHLGTVRRLVDEAAGNPQVLAKRLMACEQDEVRQIANTLLIGAESTLGGIIAFTQSMVEFLRGEQVMQTIRKTSFKLDQVTRGDPLTIYLVLPPHALESHGRLLRLWISVLLTCITRRVGRPALNTLLLLDEAAAVGELPQYRQAVTLMRSYGLSSISYWQDVSQLQRTYGAGWKALINNCRALQFLGAPHMAAAKDLADAIGWQHPEELLGMKPRQMLVQMDGQPARSARMLDYREDPEFAGLFDANPFYVAQRPVMAKKRRVRQNTPTVKQGKMQGRHPLAPPVTCTGLNLLLREGIEP